jgi:hypothetical protein
MGIASTTLSIAKAIRYDAGAIANLRAEYSRLAQEIAVDGGGEITSATVNGQSFTKQPTMTKTERLSLLDQVLWRIDNNNFYQSRRTYYSGGYQ